MDQTKRDRNLGDAVGANGTTGGQTLTRRQFVKGGLLATVAAATAPAVLVRGEEAVGDLGPIPKVVLGKTGEKVSILGLGTACLGHKNNNNPEVEELVGVFSEAIDRGVTYIDTARIYGRAEEALGEVLRTRRDKVFLVSKVWANTADEARRSLEDTLKQLGIDSVDLLHLHSAGDKDIDRVLGAGGSWEQLLKFKKEGKTRFIGLTGHSRPANFVRVIEESGTVDAMMIAMNFVDYHVYGFEEKVLPVARKQNVGVMAMKVFGGIKGSFRNYRLKVPNPSQMESTYHADAVRYAKSLEGVTGMVIGVHTAKQLRANIRLVRDTKKLTDVELAGLRKKGERLASEWGPRFGPVA